MNSNDETCLPRVTLLVNYWRDKTAGESYTLTIPQEIEYLRHYNLVKNIKTAPLNIKHKLVRERWLNVNDLTFQRAFSSDFMSWKNQVVPSVVMEAIAASHKGFRYNDGVNLFQHNYTTLNEIADAEAVSYSSSKNVVDPAPSLLLKLEPSEAVLQHAQSTGKHFHHWPTWNIDEYGNLQMYSVDVSPDEMIAWRRSMPGYTEQG